MIRLTYLALLAWQSIWHAILATPHGSRLLWLAALASIPLLLPLRGIWRGEHRAQIWGAYLVLLYWMAGIMEAWSNSDQRMAALVQVVLGSVYLGLVLTLGRRRR